MTLGFHSNGMAIERSIQIERLMEQYHEYGMFNGTVLVAEMGEVIFKKGYGSANFEWNILNTTDTKFRIASISKHFTAIALMRLLNIRI